jgi:hypothetical protein
MEGLDERARVVNKRARGDVVPGLQAEKQERGPGANTHNLILSR